MNLSCFPVLKVSAPAKINLNLKITAKRDDGFHELSSFFHAIDWNDYLLLEPATSFSLNFSKTSSFPIKSPYYDLCQDAPFEKIYQDAQKEFSSLPSGLHITLVKNIPIGAGLGGGSSDIAAFLQGVVLWTEKGLWSKKEIGFDDFPSAKQKWMLEMAMNYGSDAAFFFRGGFSHITGRGEKIKHLPSIGKKSILIYYCGLHISTKEAYRLYDERFCEKSVGNQHSFPDKDGKKLTEKLVADLQKDRGKTRLSTNIRYQLVKSFLNTVGENDFFEVIIEKIPHLESFWKDFSSFLELMQFFQKVEGNKIYKSMSGSGSSLYGLFHDSIVPGEIKALKRLCLEVNRTFTSGKEVDFRQKFRLPPRLFLARLFDRGILVRRVG